MAPQCVLTHVIQTSRDISLQHFTHSNRPCVTFDHSQDQTKTARGGFNCSLIASVVVERNAVVDVVVGIFDYVNFHASVGCGVESLCFLRFISVVSSSPSYFHTSPI